ncbi:MAG: hypothetical protein IJP31_01190 [Lachnospiraceae bacterium]|nr:hypothetical protein [Lachnospiraceae bacterium]
MPYTDEMILKLREEEKKKRFNTLETGIYLGGQILEFETQILMDTFSISLPKIMGTMPMEYARIKYPSEFRPQILLTTPELDVNLGFTLFNEFGSEVKAVAERIMRGIKRAYPDYPIYPGKGIREGKGYFFSFRSHALDSDVYNMSLVMKLKDRLLQGSFNCIYQQHTEWRKIVLMLWETIQEWEEEKECVQ